MKKATFLVVFTTLSLCALAQLTTNELPYGLQQKSTKQNTQQQIVLPPPDVQQLLVEDSINSLPPIAVKDSVNYQTQMGSSRFAYPVLVNYTPYNSGVWEQLPNGDKIWRLKVKIPDALSTHTYYDSFWLPEGSKFFVYSEETGQSIGAVTSEFIKGSKNDPIKFATALIYGESIVYEYYQPASVLDTAIIVINRIEYGYRNIKNPYQKGHKGIGEAHPCNEDICQTNNFQNERNAVTMIVAGSYSFSGYLINNTNNDNTPYVLTTYATIQWAEGTTPAQWWFYWDYTDCSNYSTTPTTTGATVVANSVANPSYYNQIETSFALLLLNDDPRVNPFGFTPYYLGWDRTNSVATQTGACIHHPGGDYKKYGLFNSIQTYNAILSYMPSNIPVGSAWSMNFNSNFWGEAGSSSGSPILDANNRVIGTYLTYYIPNSQCGSFNALADKFSNAWTGGGAANPANRLDYWLDPCNTGVTVLDGTGIAPTVPYTVSTTTTWNTPMVINNDIIIPQGVTLTITSKIMLGENVKIIVQPEGKLLIDGGTLTGLCGKMWGGIEVWGKSCPNPQIGCHGRVTLDNNATIENAICGICVENISSIGGIVHGYNSHFINNQQAIYFKPGSINYGEFKGCHFTVDILVSKAMVELQGDQSIIFENCVFSNNYISGTSQMMRPDAIYANNSMMIAIGSAPGNIGNGCEFNGFNRAIYLHSSNLNSIYSSVFSNNKIGILAEGTTNSQVENCQFNMFPNSIGGQVGIYLNNSHFYTIENNNFAGLELGSGTGIVTENTGAINHFVKNNSFSDLCTACLAIGTNGEYLDCNNPYPWGHYTISELTQGVQYQCNEFINNGIAISVAENSMIRYTQSGQSIDNATGNRFINTLNHHIYYPVNCFLQYLYSSATYQNPLAPPSSYHTRVGWVQCQQDDCSHYGYVGDAYYTKSGEGNIYVLEEQYLYVESVFELLSENNGSNGGNENPINWEDPKVIAIVEQLEMHPTEEFIITVGGNLPSNELEKQIVRFYELTNLKQYMDKLCYAALDILANDDEEELDLEQYRTWIGRFNTIESEYLLVESYLSMNEFDNAMKILDSIPTKYPGLDEESYRNYFDYFAIKQTYYSLEEGDDIPSHLIEEIVRLSNNNDFVAIKARSFGEIIVTEWQELYPHEFELHPACVCNFVDAETVNVEGGKDGHKSIGNDNSIIQNTLDNSTISVNIHPNPALNTVFIALDKMQETSVQYQLFDIQGKELQSGIFSSQQQELDISSLSKGIYFISVTIENQSKITKKVIKD